MYALSVRANSPPTVSPIPSGSVILGLTYRYDVQASDPDGDPLTYAFTASPNNPPTGMTIDPGTGRITWTPSATGTSSGFSVVATDPYGASSTPQAISITVSADTTAPNVELQYSPTAPAVGTKETFVVQATDNVAVTSLTLTVNGTNLPIDSKGQAFYTIPVVAGQRL